MNHRPCARLTRLTSRIPEPADYFRGLCRRPETPPDNILFFIRNQGAQLDRVLLRPDLHHRWLLIVALSGTGTVVLDGRPIRLPAGRAQLVAPLQLHAFRRVPRDIHWVFVSFDWPNPFPALQGRGTQKLDADGFRRFELALKSWMESDGTVAAAQLLELLLRLYPAAPTAAVLQDDLLARIQAACGKDPNATLATLAAGLHISESHLRARFRAKAGTSLGKYLRETRLRQSALWIRDEGLSVSSAAERAGYPEIYSFSRAFRRLFGRPPSALRKSG